MTHFHELTFLANLQIFHATELDCWRDKYFLLYMENGSKAKCDQYEISEYNQFTPVWLLKLSFQEFQKFNRFITLIFQAIMSKKPYIKVWALCISTMD